jgi:hypothetical protein
VAQASVHLWGSFVTGFDFAEAYPDDARTPTVPGALRAAAVASLGAGAIHATAAGAPSFPAPWRAV